MKRLVSLGIASILAFITAVGLMAFVHTHINLKSAEFGMWVDEAKFSSYQMLNQNMTANDIMVFGSSEFRHGIKTQFHPKNMLKTQNNQIVVVGREYYQCLSHAITLGAVAPELKNKKVVLILSSQWFNEEGVDSEAFTERFSENNYIAMLQNPSISLQDKEYIKKRCEELLACDSNIQARVIRYNNKNEGKEQNIFEHTITNIDSKFQKEKTMLKAVLSAFKNEIAFKSNSADYTQTDIDWEYYHKKATEIGREKTNDNVLNVSNNFYIKNLESKIESLKNCKSNLRFENSPEYGDLKCFLDICKSNNIEVLIIAPPINGKWYDYAGCMQETRQVYYSKIREIVGGYEADFKELSENEYTEGYFFDTVHFGWEGWVDVNEAIYRFQTNS